MPILRGEIYYVNFEPVRGREQGGTRPALVVSVNSINRQPLVVAVVPGTKATNVTQDFPSNVQVASIDSGLPFDTVFLCFQIRALDVSRFVSKPVSRLNTTTMLDIEDALRYCFGLKPAPQMP